MIKLRKRNLNVTRGDLLIEALMEFKLHCLNNIKVVKERYRVMYVTESKRKNNTEFEKNEAAFYMNMHEVNPLNIKEFEDFWANVKETVGKINTETSCINEMQI